MCPSVYLSTYYLSACLRLACRRKLPQPLPFPGFFPFPISPTPHQREAPLPHPKLSFPIPAGARQSSIQCQTFLVDRRRRCPKLRPGYIAVVVNPVPLSGPQLSAVSNQTLGFLQAYFASLRSCPLVGLISNLHTFFFHSFSLLLFTLGKFFSLPFCGLFYFYSSQKKLRENNFFTTHHTPVHSAPSLHPPSRYITQYGRVFVSTNFFIFFIIYIYIHIFSSSATSFNLPSSCFVCLPFLN